MINSDNRYSAALDPSSRKYICPRCGKKTFVLYLKDGKPIADNVGRCDRQDKCGWHYTPADYRRDHHTGKPFRPDTSGSSAPSISGGRVWTPPPMEITPPDYIPPDVVKRTIARDPGGNSLLRYLRKVFEPLTGAEVVERAAVSLGVGTAKQFGGSPVFWQIDQFGKVRTGKVMGYNPDTGKRIKEPKPLFKWAHKMMTKTKPDYKLQQCYFGVHRIKGDNPIIWMFESEKTALIALICLMWGRAENIFFPVACGGCEGLSPAADKFCDVYDKHRIFLNKRVVLFPDVGKFSEWREAARRLQPYCKEVFISEILERRPRDTGVNVEFGDDLGDVLIRAAERGKDIASIITTAY